METNIMWIHGWGMSPQAWGDVSTLLPGINHHFFTYADCDTMESFQVALQDQLLKYGEKMSWTLIGWSLGGMLALEHWMNNRVNPADYIINSIIIVAGSLRFSNTNRQLGWPERVIERMRKQLQHDPQETLQQFASLMFSDSERESAAFSTMKATLSTWIEASDFTPAGLDAGLVYLRNTDLIARLEQLDLQRRLPILWLHGAEDSICLLAGMPALNPSEVFIFPETGHIPFLTKSEIFYDQVRSFLYADHSHNA